MSEQRGSWCTLLSCLEHRKEGFVRLDVDPPRFVHTGGMVLCESVPPFDLDELLVPRGGKGVGVGNADRMGEADGG